ncbi:hypothetical protein DH2020_016804 [Rehmannia glutinosa]|uniref:CASP-like protein n=1 Tax=Rehmannia glutinosa TaxID=99300 RepID=A0ABR0WSJ5_REHGL
MGILGNDVSNLQVLDFSLRLLLIPFNAASIWIVVTNHQDNSDYGKLEFNNLTGLNAISAGYAVFAALSSLFRCLVTKAWLFFVTDQVLAYLMVTSMAAQSEFLYLAYNGDRVVSWSQACDSYAKFCNRLKLAMGFNVIAVCCFLVLAVISAYRVFRKFQPPFVPAKEAEQQRT